MTLRLTTACLLLAAGTAIAAPTPQGQPETPAKPDEAAVRLASHRAVYDLSLAGSTGTRAVESARGRIAVDFSGDACKGYTMQTRQVTMLDSGESGNRNSDLRSSTFESGDGKSFRFKTTTLLNGRNAAPIDGTAEAGPDAGKDALKVKLKEPKRDGYKIDEEVFFPSRHMRRLVQAARAGETTLALKLFDGSDDGRKVYDTLAVIGRPTATSAAAAKPDRDKPLREGELATMRRWPVVLSYFTPGAGERTPIYTLSFDLYENGVSGRLHLDYGDFAIDGDMTRLDLAKADPKEAECRQP